MTEEPEEPKIHPKRLENKDAQCPRHDIKEYRYQVETAWKAGWWCRRAKNNHILCYPPRRADEREKGAVDVPSTPRKQGTLGLTAGKFKKLGLDVRPGQARGGRARRSRSSPSSGSRADPPASA